MRVWIIGNGIFEPGVVFRAYIGRAPSRVERDFVRREEEPFPRFPQRVSDLKYVGLRLSERLPSMGNLPYIYVKGC
jgi:hypothetical protein